MLVFRCHGGSKWAKQRHTASRIFERLRDEWGYAGGYTAVRELVKELTSRNREVFVPLSHPPGEAQVDTFMNSI